MKRALTAVAAALVLTAGACGDDDNDPQRANTGDTVPSPTTMGATSTSNP